MTWEVGRPEVTLRISEQGRATGGEGMEGRVWPKGTCPSKTRPGHRAGDASSAMERVRQSPVRIEVAVHAAARTTSTTWKRCALASSV